MLAFVGGPQSHKLVFVESQGQCEEAAGESGLLHVFVIMYLSFKFALSWRDCCSDVEAF